MLLITFVDRKPVHDAPGDLGDRVGMQRIGVLRSDGRIVPIDRDPEVSASGMLGLITDEADMQRWITHAGACEGPTRSVDAVTLLPPVPNARKILCVGLNYPGHAKEQGLVSPRRPLYFAKAPTALIGARDDIIIPREECGADYEVELGVVIGRRGRAIAPEQAMALVAGFTIINDVSARLWQKDDGQWFRAKSRDTFCPCGPGILPRFLVPDVGALRLTTQVNGATRQDDLAGHMRFDIPRILADISAHITLEPGDLIATGSPAGSGGFQDPPVFLRAGDVVRCSITGMGSLTNRVVMGN